MQAPPWAPALRVESAEYSRLHDSRVYWLFGLPVDQISLAEASTAVAIAALARESLVFVTPNLNFLRECAQDSHFRDGCLRSDLSLADGTPLLWLARLAGFRLPHRVAGSDLFDELLEGRAGARAKSDASIDIFFFGGPPGAAQAASIKVNEESHSLRCVGFFTPGFGTVADMSDAATLADIKRARPQFLVVSLGARKGTEWIDRNRSELSGMVISHLGAVVNFAAGTVSRAPGWMRLTGLEWVWRILEEPRLVERYARDGMFLLRLVFFFGPMLLLLKLFPGKRAVASADFTRDAEGPLCVHVSGSFTGESAEQIDREARLRVPASDSLLVDLSEITDVDARGLGILYVWLFRRGWQTRINPRPLKHWRARLKFQLYRAQALLGLSA
jgi:N-acetylglucosaminyldiphosphoundecaprenol N-acetyl-beta-D-mannosaminyltransferase